MAMDETALWRRYCEHLCDCPPIGLRLDPSRMAFDEGFFERMAEPMAAAFRAMDALERGAIANPDENRKVGHYWLRAPWLAPTGELTRAIESTVDRVKDFAAGVHGGTVAPPAAERFTDVLCIGIGGSALGPQFVADALGHPHRDRLQLHFFDNTDPDGFERRLAGLESRLSSTLVLVISKSGATKETRNGLVVAQAAFRRAGLDFPAHAVAVTGRGSKLDQLAAEQAWIGRFPMWDWVGGRFSLTSAVGLLPLALQGVDVDALLAGAAACDEQTRRHDPRANPAALMALMWHQATGGRAAKALVTLPYKDRLLLLSRYLQQLIMESLGKEKDLDGRVVHQGLTVYGNKGSTDQHAFVQQLRDGADDFFVTFVEVLEDLAADVADPLPARAEVEPGVVSGDYLRGFLLGTRRALADGGRESMTLTIRRVDPWHLGVLVALFERTVGLYARLLHVNAYHQPGVEAGKKAAGDVLALQGRVLAHLEEAAGPRTAADVADALGEPSAVETVFQLCEGLAANGRLERRAGETATESAYRIG